MRARPCTFEGLKGLELRTAKARMVVVTEVGPRIAFFGAPGGSNLFFWDAAQTHRRGRWQLRGGHRVWTTRPGADEAEETYAEDNAACEVQTSSRAVRVTGTEHPTSRLRKSLEVRPLGDDTFAVEHRVTNASDLLWAGGLWGLSCTLPGSSTRYGIPLGDDSEWDAFSVVIPKRWAGHRSRVNDPQLQFTEDWLEIEPQGEECKRMIQAPHGLIGMSDPDAGLAFIKRAAYEPAARYPLNTNLAFYVGPQNFMVEMETMGPEVTLKPGASLLHTEIWALRPPVAWSALGRGPKWRRLLQSIPAAPPSSQVTSQAER